MSDDESNWDICSRCGMDFIEFFSDICLTCSREGCE